MTWLRKLAKKRRREVARIEARIDRLKEDDWAIAKVLAAA